MSKIQLSHSARDKYEICPKLYELHYIEKIRPEKDNSNLAFGGAIDKAAEIYLNTKDSKLCLQLFRQEWKKVREQIENIEFSSNDCDIELIPELYHKSIIKDSTYTTLSTAIKAEDKRIIRSSSFYTLAFKGEKMLETFIKWVDENVAEVLGTQLKVEYEDEDGNKITGSADFVVKVYGYDKPILIDLKTSARYYARDSVKESQQLALYFKYLKETLFPDLERAAYLVLSKNIKKNKVKTCKRCKHVTTGRELTCAQGDKKNRCHGDFFVDITPEAVVQYLHDEIPEGFIQDTITRFNISLDKIKSKNFEPCWGACDSMYGRKCVYYDFCRSGSMEGLKKKESQDEKKQV